MSDLGRVRKLWAGGGAGKAPSERVEELEPAPSSDYDFMTRVQLALDLTPRELANKLDVTFYAVVGRDGPRAAMSNWMADPFWSLLRDYVNDRIGGLMAMKEELDRKERLDRRDYEDRVKAIRES